MLGRLSAFHDPTWPKAYGAAAVAIFCALSLVLMRWREIRTRKLHMFRTSVSDVEAFEPVEDTRAKPDDQKIISVAPRVPSLTRHLRKFCLMTSTALLCVCSALYIFWSAAILTNWSDGDQRSFIGDPIGAIVCYKKALRFDHSLKHTHLRIAQCLLQSGKISSAIKELELTVQISEPDASLHALLGDAMRAVDRDSDATGEYQKAVSLEPRNLAYRLALGQCLESLAFMADAYDCYEAAYLIDDRNVAVHLRLGALQVSRGHIDEGIAHCRRAIALQPANYEAHYYLATAYARVKFFVGAIEEYKKAIDLNPRFIVAYYNLGYTLELTSQSERAAAAYRTCIAQEPHDQVERAACDNARTRLHRLANRKA